jgi:membrane associated rhomboid family serine protease
VKRRMLLELDHLPTPALRVITVLNLVVFGAWVQAALSGAEDLARMTAWFTVSSAGVAEGRVWTLLTSGISHASLPHLLFNMLALWAFAPDVERLVGSRGFVHLYVAGAIVSSLGHLAYTTWTGNDIPALGASGALMAVAVVSALVYPGRRLIIMFLFEMSAISAVSLFVLLDLTSVIFAAEDGVAHGAHLGGALYGLIYHRLRLRTYLVERLEQLGYLPPRAWVEHQRRLRER